MFCFKTTFLRLKKKTFKKTKCNLVMRGRLKNYIEKLPRRSIMKTCERHLTWSSGLNWRDPVTIACALTLVYSATSVRITKYEEF